MFKSRLLYFLPLVFFIFFTSTIAAQWKINAIEIEGNAKTKQYIIVRELPYRVGDVINKDSLAILNEIARNQLVNSSLFTMVSIEVIPFLNSAVDTDQIIIHIKLKERWYFFPRPYFRWADRNFSEWWTDQHRSLDRVNYGLNVSQFNATGNNDKLIVGIIAGYTKQNLFRYQIPFIDKKLKYGLALGWTNYSQKEINYTTKFDKQIFLKTATPVREGYRANISLLYRPNLYERHSLQVGLGEEKISDSVFFIAPQFLPNHKKAFNYLDITVAFSKQAFDYNAYPKKGKSTEFILTNRLAAENNFTSAQFRKMAAYPISKSNFIFIESNSVIKIMPNYNYTDAKLVGYGNMQFNGLEYYIIDGNAATLFKAGFHHSLGKLTVKNPIKQLDIADIKYEFFIRFFTNLGYVYSDRASSSSRLSNTLIRSAGVGLDLISIYDFVLKIDYSVNQLGDKGVYLHGGINF